MATTYNVYPLTTKTGDPVEVAVADRDQNGYQISKFYSATRSTIAPVAVTTAASRTYQIQYSTESGSAGQLVVNVPWTDTTYTLPFATPTALGGIKIGFTTSGTFRQYAVLLSNEQAYVNVPWADIALTTVTAAATYAITGAAISGIIDNTKTITFSTGRFAPLGTDGLIPSTYLPSYVDDVVEGYYAAAPASSNGTFYSDSGHTTAITPETGKIYIDITTNAGNVSYRWGGSVWIRISNPGTVTSVGLSVPTSFTVANSPITTSGTLALTYTSGYQGYTTAEATKLNGIDTGATKNTITLNGTAVADPSFYAPTAAGIAQQVLISNGSGAPVWTTTGSVASGDTAPVSGGTVYTYVGNYVQRIAFANANTSSLDGIIIGGNRYKVVPCGDASGTDSTAFGFYSTASGADSTASGVSSTASGDYSTASGYGSTASGFYSTASGYGSTASGDSSTASGYGSTASGDSSTASGDSSTASGDYSTASGTCSTAFGAGSSAYGCLYIPNDAATPVSYYYGSTNNIANSFTLDGVYNSVTAQKSIHPNGIMHMLSPSNIVFRNADQTADTTATAIGESAKTNAALVTAIKAVYTGAMTLQDYLDLKLNAADLPIKLGTATTISW
jgi:hypothetical protein